MTTRYENAMAIAKQVYNRYGLRKEGTAIWTNNVLVLFRKAKDNHVKDGYYIQMYHKEQGEPLSDILIFAGRKVFSIATNKHFNLSTALRSS